MATTYTPNLDLPKHAITDPFDITLINEAMDKTDAAVAGKAPAGYGLGGEAKELTSADNLDDIWQNGNYYWTWRVPQNAPVFDYNTQGAYGYMRVDSYQNGVFTQTIRSYHAPNAGVTVIRTRTDNNTIVEWVNPPMKIDVEYRTTERYNGAPVYTKLIDFGALPGVSSKSVAHGITGKGLNVRYNLTTGDTGVFLNNYPGIKQVSADGTDVSITTSEALSALNVHVGLWYTK